MKHREVKKTIVMEHSNNKSLGCDLGGNFFIIGSKHTVIVSTHFYLLTIK